jgi:lipoate-protein ligase B
VTERPSEPTPPGLARRDVIWWLPLGRREYRETWSLQQALVTARYRREIPDLVISVEHPHVITSGRSTDPDNLLSRRCPDGGDDVPVVDVERGGDITYHGPGQLVAYFLFDLEARGRDLHRFLRDLEEVQIRMLARLGLAGGRFAGKTGVWVGDRKVGSIGLAVRRWITYHGFALNVNTDLRYFALVHPCGFGAHTMTSVAQLLGRDGAALLPLEFLRAAVAEVFDRPVVKVSEKRVLRRTSSG